MNWLRRLWNGSDLPRDKHGRVIEPRNVRDGGRGELPPPLAPPPREWSLSERQRMMMVETEHGPISLQAWHARNAQQRRPTAAEAMRDALASRNMAASFDNVQREALASNGDRMTRLRFEAMSERERKAWCHSRRVYTPVEALGSPHEPMRWFWHGPEGDEDI